MYTDKLITSRKCFKMAAKSGFPYFWTTLQLLRLQTVKLGKRCIYQYYIDIIQKPVALRASLLKYRVFATIRLIDNELIDYTLFFPKEKFSHIKTPCGFETKQSKCYHYHYHNEQPKRLILVLLGLKQSNYLLCQLI